MIEIGIYETVLAEIDTEGKFLQKNIFLFIWNQFL